MDILAVRPAILIAVLLPLLACGGGEEYEFESPLAARRAFVEAVHPAPFRTLEYERMLAEFESLAGEHSGEELSVARAYREFFALFGDSHLVTSLPQATERAAGFVPFLVKRVEGEWLIDACLDGDVVGQQIASLNGVDFQELMERIAAQASVDGARLALQVEEAERKFFEFMYLEFGPQSVWRIVTEDPSGTRAEQNLRGISAQQLGELSRSRISAAYWGESRSSLPLLDEYEGVAVLRLGSFGGSNREEYLAAVEALAPTLAEAERLIIDLRGNEGGDRSLGIALTRHLLGVPFTQWARVRARVRAIPRRFRAHARFLFGDASTLADFPGVRTASGWVLEGDPLADTMTPARLRYDGPLVLIVDDATNSAAIEMAVGLLAYHPDVTVVGEETQGECSWHIGQLPVLYDDERAPALLVSLFEIELVPYSGCAPGRGIQPHVEITYSREQFEEGVDPFLEAALRVFRQ